MQQQQQQASYIHQQAINTLNSLNQPSYFTPQQQPLQQQQQQQQPLQSQPQVMMHNGMSSSQGEAKRKRVQVPAACAQCKRAHAACSNTRPCDRCVRINQADACVNSHLASMRPTTTKQDSIPVAPQVVNRPLAYDINAPPPIVLGPNNSVPFNENDVSRFLFEETNVEQFPEFPEHFECMEACATPESPCALSSSSSSTCSSPAQPQSTPSPQTYPSPPQHSHIHAQQQTHQPPAQQVHQHAQQMHQQPAQQVQQPAQTLYPAGQPPFMVVDQPVPLPSVGPSPAAVAATLAAQSPHAAHAQHVGAGPMPIDAGPDFNAHAHVLANMPQHSMNPVAAPSNMMEVMVNELIQQNKKMESMLMSLGSEMKTLKQEMTSMKQAGNPMLTVTKVDTTKGGPATAVWTVNDGLLIEHNHKFAQLLDLIEVPKGYSMQHFFGGPCSKAASSRMNHHLENIKNSQPVTDYAVIERKRVSGEVMRLMIVVNVVPTTTPVFITTMYEL